MIGCSLSEKNIFGKQAVDEIIRLLIIYSDGFRIEQTAKIDMTLRKETKLNETFL